MWKTRECEEGFFIKRNLLLITLARGIGGSSSFRVVAAFSYSGASRLQCPHLFGLRLGHEKKLCHCSLQGYQYQRLSKVANRKQLWVFTYHGAKNSTNIISSPLTPSSKLLSPSSITSEQKTADANKGIKIVEIIILNQNGKKTKRRR